MDREILFKAKRVDTGEWVEGYFSKHPKGKCTVDVILDKCKNPPDSDPIWERVLISYEIDHETICQFTGLIDSNKKKIWENDIVLCKQYIGGNQIDYHVELGYVEMKYGAFGLHREQGYYRPFKDWLEDYEYEVIGNIFDDSELLEQEK